MWNGRLRGEVKPEVVERIDKQKGFSIQECMQLKIKDVL